MTILEEWGWDELEDLRDLVARNDAAAFESCEPPAQELDLRALLASIAFDELYCPEGTLAQQAAELQVSAERVRQEYFWYAYLQALERLRRDVESRWREGKLSEDAAKGLSWLLETLPKLVGIVDMVKEQAALADKAQRDREHWRAVRRGRTMANERHAE